MDRPVRPTGSAAKRSNRPTGSGPPRWVYAIGISALVVVLVLGVLTHRGGGMQGHMSTGAQRP
ncbi:MAG: hypothetical protein ABI231_02855 [Candidatus Tumulicola sp.]